MSIENHFKTKTSFIINKKQSPPYLNQNKKFGLILSYTLSLL